MVLANPFPYTQLNQILHTRSFHLLFQAHKTVPEEAEGASFGCHLGNCLHALRCFKKLLAFYCSIAGGLGLLDCLHTLRLKARERT